MSAAKLMAEKTSFWHKLKTAPSAASGQLLASRNQQQD